METILHPKAQQLAEPGESGQEVFLFPVSFAQQRLWFLSRLHPGSPAYNLSSAYRLSGDLRLPVLRRALDEVVRRHEILRTTFALSDGEPVQVVAGAGRTTLPVVDLSGLAPERRETVIRRLLETEAERPFDLLHGPLLRLLALRCGGREHVLFCGLHHIVTDGWSEAIFARELGLLYTAFAAGQPSPLPELPIQYGDFAQWQRDWLQEEALDDLLAYWKQQLAGAPAVLDLPTDCPRPAVFSHRGAVEAFTVPPATAVRLRTLQEQEGVTPFVLLLTAFGVLLHRVSGQEDLLVGAPVASRSRAELEDLIGLFVNTLVFRLEMSGAPSFRQLLHRVRETVFGAQEHQDLLFERLVSELDLDRDPGRNPLFQVAFTLDNTPAGDTEVQGLAMTPVSLPSRTAKFDLQLTMREAGSRLAGFLEYSTDLFEAASLQRMAGHFLTLLDSIAEAPDRELRELPMLDASERQEILRWSQPSGDPGPLFCLHEAFAVQAMKTPDAIAVVGDGATVTYGELHRRSDRLARRLQDLGAGPETRTGIYMERSPDLVVAILGVLKAGGAYVPLDTVYPPERLIYMLEDSSTTLVLTQSRLALALAGATARILPIDAFEEEAALPAAPPTTPAVPANAAYVIYTSGSTGRPKGVVVSHAAVARLFNATRDWFHFDERDTWTLFHSHAFDFSVWELWGALLHGGRLVIVPYLTSRSPELFAELLHGERVTVLNQTPSAFRVLTLAIEAGEAPRPRDLRWVIFGGEALELRSLEPWWRLFGDRSPILVNMYGITETTVHVTYRPLSRADLDAGHGSMIGRGLPDLDLYVLDPATGGLVPAGVPGELHVGGAGLARGYLARPALTAERFVPDPFGDRPGARLYRSGDLARWRPSGDLEYLGRIDDQVKIRGFRIELGEIAAALRRQPGVRDALVMLREDTPGDRRLVAYFVAAGELSYEALRASLGRELPDYMVPTAWVALEALPLTPHGKIDRRALPAPRASDATTQRGYVAPRNQLEEALADVWAETLGIGQVGVHDSFFALGGDSIRSLKVVAAARERGLRFPVHQLFQFPTVAELAAALSEATAAPLPNAAGTAPFSLLSPEDRERLPSGLADAYPMASLQTGMLYHREETLEAPLFHNVNSYHLRMRFNEEAFQRSVRRAVRRHPILRTSFDLVRFSEPLQLVHAEAASPLGVEDLRHLPAAVQEETLALYWHAERHRPFDLASAPQIRLRIHRRTDESFQFTLTENHAILDGWSLHTLYSEILSGYFAALDGAAPPERPPLCTTYRDFIALEREALASPASREFWERQLAGCTVLKLPRWPRPDRATEPPRFRRLNVPIPRDVLERLRHGAEAWSVPLKTLFLSAHLVVMGFVAGEDDVLTALSTNGRPETADAEGVCGLFLNALPLRLRLAAETWENLVGRVHRADLEMMPHRRYPLAAIQERHGREALFETAFIYLNFHVMGDVVRSRGVELLGTGAMVEETNFALATTFQHGFGEDAGVHLSLDCGTPEIADEQLRNIADYYLAALRSLAREPGAWLDTLLPLSLAERQTLLAEWNDTRVPLSFQPLHQYVEEQAARGPGRPAVIGEEETLSYGELIRRARDLAARLLAAGVGPEDVVGLLAERSPELIVGALGILLAGGAYLPLDPGLPADRLSFLVDDARPRLVLTQERLVSASPPGVPVLLLEGPEAGGGLREAAGPETSADQLAYVIYTSGSTGWPKGVGVTHRSLANQILWRQAAGIIREDDRILFKTTISFDVSIWEIFGPLVAGAVIVIARPGRQGDPGYLTKIIAGQRVTGLQIPPSLLRVFLDDPGVDECASLRCLICGGELLPIELRERVFARLGVALYDLYGPTEATIEGLGERCLPGAERPTIGRPIGNVQAYVLDGWMRPAPAGTRGELYLGGEGVARGYLGRPDLTAERFVPDPFATGTRLYRTGDVVRWLLDGRVEFLGRTDHQVKVRGVRIELGEIERALLEHPALSRTAVVVQGDESPRLVAYWVPASGTVAVPRELRAFLAKRLPDPMVPSLFVRLEALPLLPSGKLDLQALPAAADSAAERGEGVPPRDPVEMQLVHVWEEILGAPTVGVTDDFFELGGTSLLAVRLVATLRERFHQEVPLATILEGGTIERMAEILRGGMGAPAASLIVAMQPLGEKRPLYCVAPGHGSILCYVALARHMGTGRPFFGLQWPDQQHDGDPYLSVEEIAVRYLAALRELQPRGPYLLAGWSFGGLVAFEMARQLVERGEEVARLVLIDTRTPEVDAKLFEMDLDLMKAYLLVEHAKEIAGVRAEDLPLSPHDLVGLSLEEQFAIVQDKLRLRERLSREIRPEMVRRYMAVRIARMTAIRDYQLLTFNGPITLLRSQDVYTDASLPEVREILAAAAQSPTYGWDRFTSEPVEVRWIPGDHESLVTEPHVRAVATALRDCLDEAER
jgi:amino acid adenylation domain-containing protein